MDSEENTQLSSMTQRELDDELFYAMAEPDPTSVVLLLKQGANPNTRDKQGRTPLMYARSSWFAKALLEGGADLHAKDKHGDTAIVYAYRSGDKWGSELVEYLLSVGADRTELARAEEIDDKLDEAGEKLKKFKFGGKRKTKRRRKSKKRKTLK